MFNLMIILLSTINSEPIDSNNYRIAHYILENIESLEDVSITELSKVCYVSNSSISRFCRDIGLKDYNELKSQIAKYGAAREYAKNKFYFKDENPEHYMSSYIHAVISELNMLEKNLNQKMIHQLVLDLFQYEKVAAFGYTKSQNEALTLQFDLQTSKKIIHTSMRYANQIEYITHANKDNMIIIYSESGTYFQRMFPRKNIFKDLKNKPKIYMITSNKDVNLPYVDGYIFYNSNNDYASHPYPLSVITSLICLDYAKTKEKLGNE